MSRSCPHSVTQRYAVSSEGDPLSKLRAKRYVTKREGENWTNVLMSHQDVARIRHEGTVLYYFLDPGKKKTQKIRKESLPSELKHWTKVDLTHHV